LDKDVNKNDKVIFEGIQNIKVGDKIAYKLVENPINTKK
jgi:hypothetical protein